MLANNEGCAVFGLPASIFTSPKSYIEAVRQGLPGQTFKAEKYRVLEFIHLQPAVPE